MVKSSEVHCGSSDAAVSMSRTMEMSVLYTVTSVSAFTVHYRHTLFTENYEVKIINVTLFLCGDTGLNMNMALIKPTVH